MKKSKRIISIIIVFVLLLGTLMVSEAHNNELNENEDHYLFASELPANIYNTLVDSIERKYSIDDVKIVNSDSLYDIEVDYPDGTATAISFAVPVKYFDSKGNCSFINTKFKKTTNADKQKQGFIYQNDSNSFNVFFSEKANVGLNFDSEFELSVLNCRSDESKVNEDEFGNGKITYIDAFGKDASLEYINTTRGLKSNIIIESKSDLNEFSFKFVSDSYTPILSADKRSILIADSKKPDIIKYHLPEMYMYGSSEKTHISDNCFYDIIRNADNTYTVKIIVDKDFLRSPDTVYPVIIDPSVIATQTTTNIEDSFTSEGRPTSNYGSNSYMRIGYCAYHTAANHKMYSFVRFKTLPGYKTYISKYSITSAYLKLYFAEGTSTSATGKIYRSKNSWSESSITWDNQPTSFELTSTSSHNNCQYYNFNITSIAKKWYDRAKNYGVKITYDNLTHNDYNLIYAADGSLEKAPTLTVNYKKAQKTAYKNPAQIENNKTYNREAASAYAKANGNYESTSIWDTPSYKSTSTAPSNWIGSGENCTNFVSQCLHEGGMLYIGDTKDNAAHWYYKTVLGCYQASYTWGGATSFYKHWGHDDSGNIPQRTYITVRYASVQDALYDWSYIRETFTYGDVVQHIKSDGTIHHSMFIYSADAKNGNFLLAQHTDNKINIDLLGKLQEWNTTQSSSAVIFHRMK